MIAARIHAWGAPPQLDEIPQPVRQPGHSLVAVAAAALARLDIAVAAGTFAQLPPLPYIMGVDGAGMVLESESYPAGTRVRIRGGGVGTGRDGTCAERISVPDEALYPIAANVDYCTAATFFSPCATAYAAVTLIGRLQPGETVAVAGAAGAVGRMVVQLAAAGGAARILGIEADREHAAQVLPAAEPRWGPESLRAADRTDLLVDMSGGQQLADLVASMRPGGRAVLVGYAAGTEVTLNLPVLLAADVRLLPMNLIRWASKLDGAADELLARIAASELTFDYVTAPLAHVAHHVQCLRNSTIGRLAITIKSMEEST